MNLSAHEVILLLHAGFTDFAANMLARVTYAFALVGLRFAQGADIGGGLANQFLVDALNGDGLRAFYFENNALRGHNGYGMAEPERKIERFAL